MARLTPPQSEAFAARVGRPHRRVRGASAKMRRLHRPSCVGLTRT